MDKLARIAKAFVAAGTTASGTVVVAAQDGTVTWQEWLTIGLAAVGAGYATWRVPNRTTPPAGQ